MPSATGLFRVQCRLWLANAQVYRGDLAGAVSRCDEAIAEAAAAHDVLMQAFGLMGETFALAFARRLERCADDRGEDRADLIRAWRVLRLGCPRGESLSRAWPPAMPMQRGRPLRRHGSTPASSP